MKKIYILASALVLVSSVSAQKIPTGDDANYRRITNIEPTKSSGFTELGVSQEEDFKKAPGDVLWYENFANGLAGNSSSAVKTWTRGSSTGYSTLWTHDFTGGYYSLPLQSESRANGWMLFDPMPITSVNSAVTIDAFLESPEINISTFGTSALGLEIQHNYATCCSGSQYPVVIQVGYDDGTGNYVWITKNSGNAAAGHNVFIYDANGTIPEVRLMGITDAAQAAMTSGSNKIKLRFHWNPQLNASNDYYWWMLDDVRIKEIPAYDSKLTNFYTGDIVREFEYAMMPSSQIRTYQAVLLADIDNLGALGLTNVQLETNITDPSGNNVFSNTGGTFGKWNDTYTTFLPSNKNIGAGADSTLYYFTGFIPTADVYGDFKVNVKTVHNENDQNPSNNVASKKFAQSRFEWNHFNNANATGTEVVNDGTGSGAAWQRFDVLANGTIYGITTLLRDNNTTQNTVGSIHYVQIADDQGNAIETKEFTITADMVNPVGVNNQRTFIRLDNPVSVTAGQTIYAIVGSYGGGDNLVIAREIDSDIDRSAYIEVSGTLYLGGDDYYVGISFENRTTGVFCAAPSAPTLSAASTTISCGDAVTIDVTGTLGNAGAWYLYSGTCGGTLVAVSTTGSFTFNPSTTQTYFVRGEGGECIVFPGACGEITITVGGDTVAPVEDVATLADYTADCYVLSGDLTAPTATDACVGQVIGTNNATFPINATQTITWTYNDGNGNISTQDQLIVISDVTAPVADIATLSDVVENCEITSLTPPTATDDVSGSVTGTTDIVFPITQTTTITWTYSDGCNRKSTQDQTLVISDVSAPVVDSDPLSDINNSCEVVIADITAPTATDDVFGTVTGVADVTVVTSSGVITWTYTDGCGRTTTQTQNVTINDATAPVADNASLGSQTFECSVGSESDLVAPTATDDCSGGVTGVVTGATFPIKQSTTITWTYTDNNGNSSTQDQNVVITNEIDNTVTKTGNLLSANESNSNATYQWVNCSNNANIAGATGKDFTPATSGQYKVRVTRGSCSEESACTAVALVGVEENELANARIFPNPASKNIIIELKKPCKIARLF
jgi:hypothetical protein